MNLSGFSTSCEQDWNLRVTFDDVEEFSGLRRLFRSIPPERVGLNGEYDHSGLAKRVQFVLSERFPADVLKSLRITQRGGVVVLAGRLPDHQILEQVTGVASRVMGAFGVESYGVRLG